CHPALLKEPIPLPSARLICLTRPGRETVYLGYVQVNQLYKVSNMKKIRTSFIVLLSAFFMMILPCYAGSVKRPVHNDVAFIQDYSIKYYLNQPDVTLYKAASDR